MRQEVRAPRLLSQCDRNNHLFAVMMNHVVGKPVIPKGSGAIFPGKPSVGNPQINGRGFQQYQQENRGNQRYIQVFYPETSIRLPCPDGVVLFR